MNIPGIDLRALCRHVADERPTTAAEQQKQGFSLLLQPKKPSARQAPVSLNWDQIIHDPTYANLVTFTAAIVGRAEFDRNGGWWRTVASSRPQDLHRCLLEIRLMRQEGRGPNNPAAYLTTMLKEDK